MLRPDDAEVHSNLGNVLAEQGNLDGAVAAYHRALAGKPDYAEAEMNLGLALAEQGKLGAAVDSYALALRHKPDDAQLEMNLGLALAEQGRLDEAVESLRRAVTHRPGYAEAEMRLAFTQLYRSDVGLADILAAARRWNDAHGVPLRDGWPAHRRPAQPALLPRIGLVSADFRCHAVGFLVIPAVEGLARAGYHLTCYSNSVKSDHLTERFVRAATVWRPVVGLSDDSLAETIRADGIDILIDLSGYSAGNRLLALARKPAPIQVASWVGYPATSGLAAMDYILADSYQLPAEAEAFYTEAVVRLPDSYVVVEPPRDSPSIDDRAAGGREEITFGSFNALKKITPVTMAAWSRILARLPASRLLLKTPALNCPATRRHVAQLFAGHGIAAERLEQIGGTSPADHLSAMRRVDIALDPFPYSGGRTTVESLWMGLPVITLPGETFCSRHSLGYLSNIGLGELAATSRDHYVDLAVTLANDKARLAGMRGGLRARMLASPLCDIDRFTAHLAAALTMMWRRWCDGRPAASFDVPPRDL
jgi:predicted O-linked N-acetylglucosamine transferase (SPINDLY family)